MSRAPIAALICVAASLAAGPARPAAGTRGQDATAASVQTLLSAGRYDEAETQGRALADEVRRTHGAASLEPAFASELLVRVLRLNGRAAAPETLSLAERTVQETTARLGPADLRLAPALIGLGDVLVAEAEYPRGLAALERAVALREPRDGQPGVELAEALDRLGAGLTAAGRHPDAIRVLERSLRIRESAGAKGDVGLARTLEALGWTLQRQGDYERAGTLIRRAASIQESVATDHPDYAATLNLLGLQLWFEGQLTAAKDASARALAVATRTLRPDHPTTTRALRYLAGVTLDLGDPAQALALFEQALERAERNFGPDHYETGGYLNDVAYTLMWLGEYTAARVKLERALTIAEARFGRWDDRVAVAVDNLADVETRLGDYAAGRRLQARAEAIWRRVYGPDHPYVAITLVQQAAVLREQGAPASALPLLERALRIREKRLGPDHRDVALTLADQAATLMQLGQLSRAQGLAARAVGIWEKLGVSDAPDMATVYALYADLQARRRDVDAARTYYEKALAIRERVFGRSHPATAEAELGLARALARQGAYEAALARAVSAEATGREHFRLMMRYLPERQALSYAASRPRGLDLTMSLIDVVAGGVTAAMDGLTRGRALVLDEMAARRAGNPLQTDDPDGLRAALATARQRLANLVVRGPGDLTPAQYTALVDEARRNSELAERTLVDRSATFRAEVRRSQLGLDEVQAALPGGSVLISFLRYERWPVAPAPSSTSSGTAPRGTRAAGAYMALVLRPQHPPAAVALGSAATIDRLIHRWRRALAVEPHATGPPPSVPLKPDTTTGGSSSRLVGAELRRLVWDPLAGHVSGASRLFIVPDGALGLVPFAALPAGSTAYLIERAPPMHYLSAERDLVSSPAEPATTGRGLLALGGPAFDDVRALGVGTRHRTGTAAPGGSASSSTRSAPGACDSVETLRFESAERNEPGSTGSRSPVAGLVRRHGRTARSGSCRAVMRANTRSRTRRPAIACFTSRRMASFWVTAATIAEAPTGGSADSRRDRACRLRRAGPRILCCSRVSPSPARIAAPPPVRTRTTAS